MVTSLFIDIDIVSVIVSNVFILVVIVIFSLLSLTYCPLNSASHHLIIIVVWIQQVITVTFITVNVVDSRFVYIAGISHPHIHCLTHTYPMDGQQLYASLTSSPIFTLMVDIIVIVIACVIVIILMVIT